MMLTKNRPDRDGRDSPIIGVVHILSSARHSRLYSGQLARAAAVPMMLVSTSAVSSRTTLNGPVTGLGLPLESGCPPLLPVPSGRTLGRPGAPPTNATTRSLRRCARPTSSINGSDACLAASRRGYWRGVRGTPEEAPPRRHPIIGTHSLKLLAAQSAALVSGTNAFPWGGPPSNDQFRLFGTDTRSIFA